jgi:hypothetical protein
LGIGGNGDGGLYYYDGVGEWILTPLNEMPMDSLRAVMVDNAGTVWVGLGDSGLGGGIYRVVK